MNPRFEPAPAELSAGGAARLPSPWACAAHKPVFIAFLLVFSVVWVDLLPGISVAEGRRWLEPLFWLLAAATCLVGLARGLPEQNVLMSASIVAAISFGFAATAGKIKVPFGPRSYTDALGGKILGVPWPMPLLWLVVIINGRDVARLITRPWRQTPCYGFGVIGLTCGLTVVFDLGFEPFATHVRHFWFWEANGSGLNWYSAPWTNFLGWFAAALVILSLTTPWLINKQPAEQPTDYHPVVLWLLLNFYFATGNALQQLWPAVGFSLVVSAIVAACAVRGAQS